MSFKIIGHRGDKVNFVENTIAGFKSSLSGEGIDGIELDVVVSKDEKLLISHDMFMKDSLGNRQNIYELTYDELLTANKARQTETASDEMKYPLLEELLGLYSAQKNKKILLLEIKSLPSLAVPPLSVSELIKKVHALLKLYGIEGDKCIIISFDYRVIEESYKQNAKHPIGLILHRNLMPLSCIVDRLNLSLLIMEKGWIVKEQVLEMLEKKIDIFIWTANTHEDWEYLENMGVQGMITDKPKILAKHKKKS